MEKIFCPICGEYFQPDKKHPYQRYCSRSCSDKARRICERKCKAAKLKSGKTLEDWQREANECNLDYGTYRGLIALGKTHEEIKAQYADRPTPTHAHKHGWIRV